MNPKLNDFSSKADDALGQRAGAYLELVANETETASLLQHPLHYLSYMDPEQQHPALRDNYTSQSAILIKNARGSHIVFANNAFDSNIGIHGGAIHIDHRNQVDDVDDFERLSPFAYF